MVGSREGYVVFEKAGQLLCKGRGKLRTAVWDYFVKETKADKDMSKEQGGNSSSIDSFKTRDENHPLHKPMVDHDQYRVKASGKQKICDHVTWDLLERVGDEGRNGAKPRNSQVSVDLVGLASSAASHKLANEGGKTRPPVVALNQVNGVDVTSDYVGVREVIISVEDTHWLVIGW